MNNHPENVMDEEQILATISKYKFYHIIKLTDKITTPGNEVYVPAQNLCLKRLGSLDIKGKSVLDIGCRDGLFSFKAESMGAAKVVGIDNDLSEPATQFLIPFFHSKIHMKQLNLYDLQPNIFGIFDVVIFAGVLYHLRYPFWGLKIIRDVMKVGGHLLIETAIWQGETDKAMLFCPIDGTYGGDATSCTLFNEKGLTDTMKALGFETVFVEYLNKPQDTEVNVSLNPKKIIKKILLKKGFVKSTEALERCVLHLIYRGYDQDSFHMKYWEKEHDFHSKHGGD